MVCNHALDVTSACTVALCNRCAQCAQAKWEEEQGEGHERNRSMKHKRVDERICRHDIRDGYYVPTYLGVITSAWNKEGRGNVQVACVACGKSLCMT